MMLYSFFFEDFGNNFDEDDHDVIIRIKFLGWHSKCST